MPSTTQIVPEHEYAYTKVVVNDNSARPSDTVETTNTTYANMLFVFSSPKGLDNELRTLSNGLTEFVEAYGLGSFDQYGQPFLNAYAAASTGAATLHCLRVTADDASYAVGALVAHYKVTPGSSPEPPQPTPSDKVNVNGHANVVASDSVDETGKVTITLAGTDVVPGISADNAETFGDVTGEFIDVTLDMAKLVTLDDAKTYQVRQVNPALSVYDGKDEFISNVDGNWTKTKTYTGADLKTGYSILVGTETTIAISLVEWGVEEQPEEIYIVNNTDLAVTPADAKTHLNISAVGNAYTIAGTGEVVSTIANPDLFGSPEGKNLELDIILPGIDGEKQYTAVQTNANLEKYKSDPHISNTTGQWVKTNTFSGADALDGGYAVLLGEGKGDVNVKIYDAEGFVSAEASTPILTMDIINGFTFVDEHTAEVPTEGPIGTPTEVAVTSTMSFTTTTARSTMLRASAATAKVMRNITAPASETVAVDPVMDIYYTFEAPADLVTDLTNLGNLVTINPDVDENGYMATKIFEMACKGRGSWGNNIRFVLDSYARGDRLSSYKNYTMSIYEIEKATMTKKEEFTIAFNTDAVDVDGNTLFADFKISDPFDVSKYITLVTNPMAMKELFAAYVSVVPDTSLNEDTFDPLCGMMYGTSLTKIDYLNIDTLSAGTVSLSGASGISLLTGSDGAFAADNPDRQTALNNAYLKAYSGEIDRNIRSRKMYPTDIILDANFPVETKIAISELVTERKDCVGIFDLGTDANTYAGLMENLADVEPYVATRSEAIEAYYGKIQDPVSFKIVPVTATYALAMMYPNHFRQNGGKHVALAGSAYAVMTGFISGTAWPVYDDDLDADILDSMVESRVNFLKVNSVRQVVRGSQTTRQDVDTNLSELSNVFVLNDIRRDAVQLCEQYEYNFAEASDMQRFNKAASILADKYVDAQVASITAEFSMNQWESERGILHLYIEFVHKNIIKRSIVEIDVNRGTYS